SWADRIVVMHEGRMIQDDSTQQVYQNPCNEYAAALLGNYNIVSNELAAVLQLNTARKIIRPQHFIFVPESSNAIKGEILQMEYYGNFWMVY
ncbi:hypothetical protein ABTN71_19470, partial [Acinetobacter baumannii]